MKRIASSNCTKKLSSLGNMGAKFSQDYFILPRSMIFSPKTAKIADVLFWQTNPPTLVLSCPKLTNLPTNPTIGRHMCTAPKHVCIGKHNVGRQVCQHFGPIGFTTTKFYSVSFSTKKHSLDYYHCIIWLYYCLPLLYINAP